MPSKDKELNNKHQREWYARNREKKIALIKARQMKLKEWVKEHRATLSCAECGEDHPATLDFHHEDPSLKEVDISLAYLKGWGIERIQKEIDKCIVLCSNCHRKLHARVA